MKLVAVHRTVDSPIEKTFPLLGVHVTIGGYSALSVALGSRHVTFAVGNPWSVYTAILSGQTIFGISLSELKNGIQNN